MRPRQVRTPFDGWIDPAVVFTALYADGSDAVWLDSGPHATAGVSIIGRADETVSSDSIEGSVLDYLRDDLERERSETAEPGFALGWVGWIGYESRFETMGTERTRRSPFADASFLRLDRAIEFDHATRRIAFVSREADAVWRSEAAAALGSLRGRPKPRAELPTASGHPARWRDTGEEYLAAIDACQRAIHAGEAYLLCLTTAVEVETDADPVQTYLALRRSSPSHHGALLRIGEVSLLSSSPESFLSVSPAGEVESRPVKGTRPRGATAAEDARLATDLAASEKERAENLMIVDLMRNDIARVSEIGSVEVPSLLRVETYAPVHQLVSVVRGRLASGRTGMDAVFACFPAGSMTGAPKSSATRILDSLEGSPRGIYSGAFGYFGFDGRVDLAMVIRSIVLANGRASIGTGGGITALSVPEEELAEVRLKAAALLAALGVNL